MCPMPSCAPDPTLEEQSDKAIGDAIGYFAKQKDDVLNQFARVYALQFSMDELAEMNAFYETPTGQKLAAIQPKIDQSSGQAVHGLCGEHAQGNVCACACRPERAGRRSLELFSVSRKH